MGRVHRLDVTRRIRGHKLDIDADLLERLLHVVAGAPGLREEGCRPQAHGEAIAVGSTRVAGLVEQCFGGSGVELVAGDVVRIELGGGLGIGPVAGVTPYPRNTVSTMTCGSIAMVAPAERRGSRAPRAGNSGPA